MAVYVDPNFEWPKSDKWPWGSVSHMYADTPEELHRMAKKIGLKREWCSDRTQPGSSILHYDLNPKKRVRAVAAGCVEVDHKHKEAYRAVKMWFWKEFVQCYRDLVKDPVADVRPKNFKTWRRAYLAFFSGVVTGRRKAREDYEAKQKEKK